MNGEIGWVFIYLFAFGISDFINKKYLKNDYSYLFYYLLMGTIGFYLLRKN